MSKCKLVRVEPLDATKCWLQLEMLQTRFRIEAAGSHELWDSKIGATVEVDLTPEIRKHIRKNLGGLTFRLTCGLNAPFVRSFQIKHPPTSVVC